MLPSGAPSCGFSFYLTVIYHNAVKLSGGCPDVYCGWPVVPGDGVAGRLTG
jgi:hypothetical protein